MITLRKIRNRIQPTTNTAGTKGVLRKRDRNLIRITLIEVLVYLITTTPYTITLVYSTITTPVIKSNEQQKIESFITYLTQSFLLYLNNALPFWIYLLASPAFRVQFKNLIIRLHAATAGRKIPMPTEVTLNNNLNTH
ncbi:unnamed protein product [Rotaria magnacalcarata]|nr:unnamed protein product [Rotaria magnacalcarata]CAF2066493.1 unnamed protein product [Rotaria magnacalcarata]